MDTSTMSVLSDQILEQRKKLATMLSKKFLADKLAKDSSEYHKAVVECSEVLEAVSTLEAEIDALERQYEIEKLIAQGELRGE